jgi:predicted hydrocarbon binding protein
MSDARIGRVVVASLHQAIADTLPTRLEFYESWLNAAGLRAGTLGLPAMAAVISFLGREPEGVYEDVMRRAGAYAALWTLPTVPGVRRLACRWGPLPVRVRMANAAVRDMVRSTYPDTRVIVRVRKGVTSIDIRGSLFCGGWREDTLRPRCEFYAAAIGHLLRSLHVPATTRLTSCRGAGGEHCVVESRLNRRVAVSDTQVG